MKHTHQCESVYIIIPNPIYEVVFRHLMEDLDSSKIVISTKINEKIKSLQFEFLTHAKKKPTISQFKTLRVKMTSGFFTLTLLQWSSCLMVLRS